MNDQKIYELIAKEPGLRAVRLADLLDRDLEDVNAALAGLIGVGDVVAVDGKSPAGVDCKLYHLSEAFKATEAGKAALGKAAAASFGDQSMSRVDRAIAFVKQHGKATGAQLHAVMGLAPDQYPSSFLSHSVRSGHLKKDGKDWTPGDGKPVEPEPPMSLRELTASQQAQRQDKRMAQFPPSAIPVFGASTPKTEIAKPNGGAGKPKAKPALAELPAAAPAVEQPAVDAPPRYRAAIWSDGMVELQRNDRPAALLTIDEANYLVDFILAQRQRAA